MKKLMIILMGMMMIGVVLAGSISVILRDKIVTQPDKVILDSIHLEDYKVTTFDDGKICIKKEWCHNIIEDGEEIEICENVVNDCGYGEDWEEKRIKEIINATDIRNKKIEPEKTKEEDIKIIIGKINVK